jgi:hypothetical protein
MSRVRFPSPAPVLSLAWAVLLRSPKRTERIVLHRPVVWLTTQESLVPTQADIDSGSGPIFVCYGDGEDVRLTVELSFDDEKLVHWHKWLTEMHNAIVWDDLTCRNLAEQLPPSTREHWWCYFGAVAPSQITQAAADILRVRTKPEGEK